MGRCLLSGPQLRLVQSSLAVSRYTDVVDSSALMGKAKRQHRQLQEICALLTGFLLAAGKQAWVAVKKSTHLYS